MESLISHVAQSPKRQVEKKLLKREFLNKFVNFYPFLLKNKGIQ